MTTGDDEDPDPPVWKTWWSWLLIAFFIAFFWSVIVIVVRALRG
jgi:hypothetical protein